ncbi:MAG: hypoxanthine phosphoribosyltransferase [Clostridia bacterium]
MKFAKDDIAKVLIDKETIRKRIIDMGKQITDDYQGKDLLVVGILKGCITFMADLIREIDLPIKVDFMGVSSYGDSNKTSGSVMILKDLGTNPVGKDILIIEDIVDTGLTLQYLVEVITARRANSVRVCTFLNKEDRRTVEFHADYTGFEVPDEFVVGYGLDFAHNYRNLPEVCVLKPACFEK